MAYGYRNLLRSLQEEKKKREPEVYVVQDEKGNNVNQDRVKTDTVMAPYKARKEMIQNSYKRASVSSDTKKEGSWIENLLTNTKSIGSNLASSAKSGILQFGKALNMSMDRTQNFRHDIVRQMTENTMEIRKEKGLDTSAQEEILKKYGRVDTTGVYQDDINYLNKKMAENTENTTNPVAKKTAELSQSLGNNAVGMAVTAVNPAAGLVYFTGSAKGSYYDEAIERGMTPEEADKYSGVMAGVEGLAERYLAGQNIKGFKAILEGTGLKNAIKAFGIEIGENFVQEAVMPSISEVTALTTAGKEHLKYDFSTEEGWKELLNDSLSSGVDGALSAIILNGTTKGVASATRVVNKMSVGETVTQQEITTAIEDSQKAGIDVEGILQEEITRAAEKKLKQEETSQEVAPIEQQELIKTEEEIAPTNTNIQDEQLTQEQYIQELDALQREYLQAPDTHAQMVLQQQIDELQAQAQQQGLMQDMNAQQITDESELRKQNFAYQAQETDSDIKKAVYESASQVMNNTEKSHKFVDVVAKIAEEKGTTYKFTNNEQLKELGYAKDNVTVNGLVNENGEVLINIDSAKALNTVVGHETTHLLEGTQEYEALKQVAIEYAKTKGDYDTKMAQLHSLYKDTNANIENELVSDIVGDYLFTDEAFVKELSIKQPTLFEKIKNFISDLVVKFKGTEQEKQLRQLQRSFEKAYKAQGTKTVDQTQYSLESSTNENMQQKIDRYSRLVEEMQQEGKNADDWVPYANEILRLQDQLDNADIRYSLSEEGEYDYQKNRPKISEEWTIEKIQTQLEKESSNGDPQQELAKFNNVDEIMENLYYHGSTSLHKNLKAGSTIGEAYRGGGYGQEYHSISLSKSKNVASNFSSMASNGVVTPVLLKKGANVIEMSEIEDSIEIEDILPELWEQKIDAVKIGEWDSEYSEQELVVLNPNAITVLENGAEYYATFRKPKFPNMTKTEVENLVSTYKKSDVDMSLSAKNEEIAPTGNWNVRGEDIKLQIEEAVAPLQETVEKLTEQVQEKIEGITEQLNTVVNSIEEIQAPVSQEVVEKQRQDSLDSLMNEVPPVQNGLTELEQQEKALFDEFIAERGFDALDEQSKERYKYFQEQNIEEIDTDETEVISPLEDRNIDEVGNRKVKAYQYENPEVRPYFQAEAENMLYDLDNTIKGEKIAIKDQEGYITDWAGITRQTTEAIAYLKDNYGYSYAQIRKGLNDIIEDNGKENNAVAKRIEFMLDERLREGYTTSDGIPIPANEDYINFLKQKNITQYSEEAYTNWQNTLDELEIPVETENIPVAEKIEAPELPVSSQTEQVEQLIPMEAKTAQNQNTDVLKAKARSWVKTSTESDVVDGKISINDLDVEKISYVPITNKETLAKANAKLSENGYEESLKDFNSIMRSGKLPNPVDITLGQRLMQEALARGEKETAIQILQDISILDTEMGQVIQATSIIQRMTPAGQLRMAEKIIKRGELRGDKAFKGLKLTDDMKQRIMATYNEDGQTYDQDKLNEVMEQIKQELADQMPVTKMEKINEWRYFAMLGNPKTHIRNIVSNVANYGTIELKNALARTIETVAPIENRTKTWKRASQEIKDFAKQTTLEMKDVISGENQVGIKAEIKSKRKIFKREFLNKLTGGNSDIMTMEDWWFSGSTFRRSFQEFLTANGINTQQDIQNNPKLIEKGKAYALEQSQIATFRQYSYLASKINEIERKNAATQIVVGSILPFKKTPINIAKAGLSYSPIGALKSLTYDLYQVKQGKMEASTAIDHIAQGATGTALTLVGYLLSQMGFLNGAGEDDKEGKYDYQLGKQGYSLNIGGNTYSLSWLSPVAMPLFVGANAHEQLVEGKEWNANVVIETLGQTIDPLSEMSFVSSLTDALSSYESGGIQKLWGTAETMAQSYATQFIPTASSQLAATLDDTKRSTKVSGDSNAKFFEETYNKLIYKIPGLRNTLEPTTDIWGNDVKQSENLFTRALENFISPYARKESIATEIDGELKDLYSETGENGILPNIPYNYVNFEGEKYKMSAEEYTEFKKTYGQTANDLLEDLFRTTTYKTASSEDKVDMVNDVYDYASDLAKKNYLSGEGVKYTNATKDKEKYYKENDIKGAIANDMSVEEYRLYSDDPEEYEFLKDKDISYRRKYFDMQKSISEIEDEYKDRKDEIPEGDMTKDEYNEALDALSLEKKADIVDKIINSGLDDSEKANLYKRYYNSDKANTMVQLGINVDDFLTYETMEFKADKNSKGKTISGSRKNKVVEYVNSLALNIPQKAIIIKSTNTFKFNDYNEEIVNYVGGLDLTYEEKTSILEDLGMTVKNGRVYWE